MISAKTYHLETSYDRFKMKGHYLDWTNQPQVFKQYPGLGTLAIPQEVSFSQDRLSELLERRPSEPPPRAVSMEQLSQILLLAYAPTARIRHRGGDFYYRSAPSAGALYPCEIYVGAEAVCGLEPGLYHYAVHSHALAPLRQGYLSPSLVDAVLPMENDDTLILSFFVTAIFFRSAWKYRERAYRYHLLDTGHLTENLALATRSQGLCFSLDEDFHDEAINDLLGLDVTREVCLALVRVWGGKPASGDDERLRLSEVTTNVAAASRVAAQEVQYPMIQDIQRSSAGTIKDPGIAPEMPAHLGIVLDEALKVLEPEVSPEELSYPQAVMSRRSKRNFIPAALPQDHWRAMLRMLGAGDAIHREGGGLGRGAVSVGFLAGHVEGLDPGFYLMDRSGATIHLIARGSFMKEMAHICLDQEWLANAALHFVFLTNLSLMEESWGPRGYRYVMMTAGRLGQRIYLAATAMGMGCCGIGAFYDPEAVRLLGLNEASRLLYLVAAGPVKK